MLFLPVLQDATLNCTSKRQLFKSILGNETMLSFIMEEI